MTTQLEITRSKLTKLEDLYRIDPVKACRKALRLTANIPEHDRMQAINDLLGMYGVEAIRGEWQNGYWCDIVGVYANTGDSYATTVLQIRGEFSFRSSRFIVSSWGDWIEKNQTKYGIE